MTAHPPPRDGFGPDAVAAPLLPCRDVARSIAWWARLGFLAPERGADPAAYAVLRCGRLEVHLFHDPGLDPADNDAGLYLRVADCDLVRAAWAVAGVEGLGTAEDKPWGMREFALLDPDLNLIRVGSPAAAGRA